MLIFTSASGQQKQIDSLLNLLDKPQADTTRGNLYHDIAHYYMDNNNTLAIQYFLKAINIRQKYHQRLRLGNNYYSVGYCYLQKSDFARSLDYYLKSINIYAELKDNERMLNAYMSVANVYMESNDFVKSKEFLDVAEALTRKIKNDLMLATVLDEKGLLFDHLAKYDSALVYHQRAYQLSIGKGDDYSTVAFITNLGLTYKHQHNTAKAMVFLDTALAISIKKNMAVDVKSNIYNNIANTYAEEGNYAAAKQDFEESILLAKSVGIQGVIMENYHNLADMYTKMNDYKQQAYYLRKYYTLKDSLFTSDSKNQLTQLEANFRIGQKNELITEQQREVEKQTGQRNIFFVIASGAALLLIVSIVFYSRIRKNNSLLVEKNNQINNQKDQLQFALTDLKATQAQLIQSEKMASLGELTAGIAHEIQNPLNFVNNFSDISSELIDEMKDELAKGNYKDVNTIADDVKDNLKKITQHGKRADSIVKAMLQHSRTSSGQRELTDVNAMCDEYIRLSYHGLRAKDKSFNADIEKDFDETLPNIKIVPQDIGRVLLNLLNNAFYAVNEKKASLVPDYQPTVSVQTKRVNDKVEIKVSDNGNGIPQSIVDKIFQPFFTTKPTGQGTGLGLSLTYDIIKTHGGEVNVQTEDGKGTTFIVLLPS